MEYMALVHPQEPDVTAYERILATLCRPVRKDLERYRKSDDWDGDVREPYNESRATDRAHQLTRLPEPVKLALFEYFERSANDFLSNYERLFGGVGHRGAPLPRWPWLADAAQERGQGSPLRRL